MTQQTDTTDISKQEEKAHRIAALISGYIHHALTVEEHDELDEWVGESDENMRLFEDLTDENVTQEALDWLTDADGPRILNKLKGKLSFTPPRRRFFSRNWHYGVAATVALLIVSTVFLVMKNKTTTITTPALAANEKPDLPPGRDQATLTLADGSTILLDKAKDGSLATQGNSAISKQNGQLQYKTTGTIKDSKPLQNTVTTPRGGSYPLILSDGTKVWLNAASSISFPAVFTGNERRVAITGEVYFEVASATLSPQTSRISGTGSKGASKKTPFLVELKDRGITVEVLGTHFNINAYPEEALTNTTLLEGAVKVSVAGKTSFLKPDQQAQVSKTGEIKTVSDVNTMKIMAWKDGFFRFNGEDDIKTIMGQIARWYDVDVEFNVSQSTTGYNCMLSRNLPVSKILNALEESGDVHFKIEGKKIKVLP